MFNPAEALRDNPALFACYVLFVYFRGRNAVRIEREMRSLGYTTFHRRNLYPRGKQPGWIAKYNWSELSTAETPSRGENENCGPQIDTDKHGSRTPDQKNIRVHQCPSVDKNSLSSPRLSVSAVKKPDFHAWLKRVSPTMTWDWRHQQVIIEQLEKVTSGDCKRLMIFLPPRHGKTELVSVRYTAWRMQQDPSMNVILGSYNQRLADRMSRKIRTAICDSEAIRLGASSVPPAAGVPARASRSGVEDAGGVFSAHRSFKQDAQDKQDGKRGTNNDHPLHPVHPVPIPSEHSSPFPFSKPRPKNAVSEWETAMGGSFRAVGAGSGVTGFGANLIVIDDPVKNRAQAESETFRNRVWDWYKDDLYTRLEPDGSIVLIQTRWHEDDLAGRLLRDDLDDWTIINLPALSEPPASAGGQFADTESPSVPPAVATGCLSVPPAVAGGDLSSDENQDIEPQIDADEHRSDISVHPRSSAVESPFEWRDAPNIALCPERFDIDALEQQRRQLGTYSFSALYQQRPTPAGGQIFKREWFKQIIDFAPPGLRWTRGYDLAVSTRTESDYTASFRVAFDKQGNLYIAGGFRRRIEFPEQRRFIIDRMLNERDTQHGVELALHGQALLQDLRRDPALRGKSLRGVKVSTDKITRALSWSPLAEEGKVILVRTAECGVRNPGRNASVNERGDRALIRSAGVAEDSLECTDTEISPRLDLPQRNPINTASNIPHSAVRNPQSWIEDLLDELSAFPNGSHDDQIDAISIAVHMHSTKPNRAVGMLIT